MCVDAWMGAAGWASPHALQAPSSPLRAPRCLIKGFEALRPLRAIAINLEKMNGDAARAGSSLSSLRFPPPRDSSAPHQRLPASSGPAGDLPRSVVTRVHAWREHGGGADSYNLLCKSHAVYGCAGLVCSGGVSSGKLHIFTRTRCFLVFFFFFFFQVLHHWVCSVLLLPIKVRGVYGWLNHTHIKSCSQRWFVSSVCFSRVSSQPPYAFAFLTMHTAALTSVSPQGVCPGKPGEKTREAGGRNKGS